MRVFDEKAGAIALVMFLLVAASACDNGCDTAQRRVEDKYSRCGLVRPGGPAPTGGVCLDVDVREQSCRADCTEIVSCEVLAGTATAAENNAFDACLNSCIVSPPPDGGPASCVVPLLTFWAASFVPDGIGPICTPAQASALSVTLEGTFTYPVTVAVEPADCELCSLYPDPPAVPSIVVPDAREVRVPNFVACPDIGEDHYLVRYQVSFYDACGTLIDPGGEIVFSCCRPGSPMCGLTCE